MTTLAIESLYTYDAIVFDLDGTLVELDVDWDQLEQTVFDRYVAAGVDQPQSDLWSMLESAPDVGLEESVESILSTHEREGARSSKRLPLAKEVAAVSAHVPVGVCSLNCEAAVRIALETHDLDDDIEAIVGRDSVAKAKPDPEPLLAVIDRIDADPAGTVFIGDSIRDKRTARRAGTAFEYVGDGPSGV